MAPFDSTIGAKPKTDSNVRSLFLTKPSTCHRTTSTVVYAARQ